MIRDAYQRGYLEALEKTAGGAIPIPAWLEKLTGTKVPPIKKKKITKPPRKALNHGEWTIDYSSGEPVMRRNEGATS